MRPNLLLVEDNPGDVRLMQEAVREGALASEMHVARDGEQALAFLRREGKYRASPRPDLILLDLNLPLKSGREVLAEIKREQELCRIPVMIFSTSTSPEDIEKAYDLHANCYIQKPATLDALMEVCRALENFWLGAATLAN